MTPDGTRDDGQGDRPNNVRSILPELVARVIAGEPGASEGRQASTVAAALAADPSALRAAMAMVAAARQIAEGTGAEKKPPGRAISDYVDEILAFAKRPRLSTGFIELDKVAPWPVQCVATLIGPSGTGKTSLALQIAQHHARTRGPVLFLSKELAGVLAAARVVSQNDHDASWIEVLDGKVGKHDLVRALVGLDVTVMEEIGPKWVAHVRQWLAHWKKTRAGAVPLVVADYLQILPCETARDDGDRVKYAMASLSDDVAKAFECGVIAVSKPSRSTSRALRSGESFGSDTAESGAESNAIEFYSTVQLAIGAKGDDAADGWAPCEISVGKARYRGGDHVVPFDFHGRSGVFRTRGDARTTAEVRREREAGKDAGKREGKRNAILALLSDGGAHPTAQVLEAVKPMRRGDAFDMLRELAVEGKIEEVGVGAGKAFKLRRVRAPGAVEFG
jgi:hypothetical protein